ncbi:MAG: RluA family pseudouridine synthase [Bacteroidales bacterium]|nr:RluA family pseudouridine synthase [Bacteroidales bacterium]
MEEFNQDIIDEQDDLYEHYRIAVDPGQSLLRIDKFLFNRLEGVSRNKVQNAAKAGNILVNDHPVKPNYKVKPRDVISILLPGPVREFEVIPEDIPFEIMYEDSDVLVVNKAAGLVVHPGHGNYTGTLLNALTFYYQGQPDVHPSLIHRIDKDTSGVLLIGKNEMAQTILGKQFFEHTIDRKYLALVWGDIKVDAGTIEGHIGRNPNDRIQMFVFLDGSQGRPAITHFRVLERFGYVTLVECILETGRTHQIRAHFRHLGHPLFNDEKYGGDKILKGTTFSKYKQFIQNCFSILPRQALHARLLGFTHPTTKKEMLFESPLPQDMQEVINKWRDYARHKDMLNEEG